MSAQQGCSYPEGEMSAKNHVRLPRVTRAEELLYSTDLAPIVRVVGTGLNSIHDALLALANYTNEIESMGPIGEDEPSSLTAWRSAFGKLAPIHDALLDAYRDVAKIGAEQAAVEIASGTALLEVTATEVGA